MVILKLKFAFWIFFIKIASSTRSSPPEECNKRLTSPTSTLPSGRKRRRSNSVDEERSEENCDGDLHDMNTTYEVKGSKVTNKPGKLGIAENVRNPDVENRIQSGVGEWSKRLRNKGVHGPRSNPGLKASSHNSGRTGCREGKTRKNCFLKRDGVTKKGDQASSHNSGRNGCREGKTRKNCSLKRNRVEKKGREAGVKVSWDVTTCLYHENYLSSPLSCYKICAWPNV